MADAARLLDRFWADNSARGPVEMLANSWVQWAGAWQDLGGGLPAVSPYHWPASVTGAGQFCAMLGRQVDFGRIQVDSAGRPPMLLIGAVDVLSGRFRTFSSRRDRITAATVLASAAIPNLFRAVRLEDGTYWDGLFSQNPPVRELLDARPDELWVISCAGVGAGSFRNGLCRSVPEPEGTVQDFDPAEFLLPGQARRLDRVAQPGLAAAQLAMDDAGGDHAGDPRRCGVVFGSERHGHREPARPAYGRPRRARPGNPPA